MAKRHNLRSECIAEFTGTFLFVALGAGSVAGLKCAGAAYGQWEISIIWGLAVAIAVYVTAGVSGAHLNPSVSLALAVFGKFPKRKIAPYIIAQALGAFAAAAIVYFLYQNLFPAKTMATAGVFTTFPHAGISLTQAFCAEFFITAVLVAVIFGLSDDGNGLPRGALTPLLVGMTVAVIGGSFGPLTGFSMNAARDFGPRLFTQFAGWGPEAMTGGFALPYALIPLIAPAAGGLCGAAFYHFFIGRSLLREELILISPDAPKSAAESPPRNTLEQAPAENSAEKPAETNALL